MDPRGFDSIAADNRAKALILALASTVAAKCPRVV